MASEEIRKRIAIAKRLIKAKGITLEFVDALFQYGKYAIEHDADEPYGLETIRYARECLEERIDGGKGRNVWQLQAYAERAGVEIPEVTKYFEILLYEAQHKVLDSFFLYIEKNRLPKDRFYLPRRKCFRKIGVIQALQDLIDDDLDILSISLPPGTGKAQPLYSKVLTPSGFVEMGDIHVGDIVISGTGKQSQVLGIFPQGKKPIYEITLASGEKCRCSADHLWSVKDISHKKIRDRIVNTATLLVRKERYAIPVMRQNNRKTYSGIINVERVSNEECQCIYIDDPSHLYVTDDYIITHNTTLEMFFHAGLLGWYPDDFSLFYSHSGDITKMYYSGVLNILTSDEYCWQEIFPEHRVYATDAKREQIHIDKYQPFASLQTTSVGAKNAGKVRAGLFLLCDDIIGGIEEALNINILDKLWNIYSVDARQRKIPGAKELHICTRWSVHDIVGRIQRLYEDSDRVRFIAVPDIDPETGKSNFNYDVNGFTEEFFHDQELAMDEISYRCLYKNDPIEREGLLYTPDELRYYADLPMREPDAVMAVCDTKSRGTDFLVLPVMYQYDNDYYLVDCICTDSSDYGVQYGRMADMLVNHGVQQCEFESNAGGDRVAFEVEKLVKDLNGRCNITTKPTETNKETRIIVNADWIKKQVLFKPKEQWGQKSDYSTFMNWLLAYSVSGKNKHDDVPDCMANFALFVQNKYRITPAYVMHNPF